MFYRSTFITLSRHASESLTTHWYDFFTDISVCNRCEIAEQSEWGKKCGKSLLFRPGRKKNNVKFYKFFFFVVKAFLFSMRLVWAAWKRDTDVERVWRLPEAWELAIVQKVKVDFFFSSWWILFSPPKATWTLYIVRPHSLSPSKPVL